MQEFMIALIACSIVMSMLGLFYMAITPLMSKRYSAKGRYYTWLIIIVGLIIPFRPQFDNLNPIMQIDIPRHTMSQTQFMGGDLIFILANPIEAAVTSVAASVSWWAVSAIVWLVGLITFLVIHAIKHYRFTKMAKRWNEIITDERIITVFQQIKNEMGITKSISLFHNSDMGSPLMYGFAKPCIVLPTTSLAEDELHFILKHELVHYKRKDLFYKMLMLIATAIHWFNPAVYLIARAIDTQCEISCDNEVVRGTDTDTRLQYSETIIGAIKYHTKIKTVLSTNFYGGKKGMKNRISSIMDTRKKRVSLFIFAFVLLVTICTGIILATRTTDEPSGNIIPIGSMPIPYAGFDFNALIPIDSDELFMEWENEMIDLLADHEIAALIAEGATWLDVLVVLGAR